MLNLVRETRGGALNDAKFHSRFGGTGVYADLLARRFARAVRQHDLTDRDRLDCSQFAPPPGAGVFAQAQLSLF